MSRPGPEHGPLGSFDGHDPDVDIAKVQDYVDWKQSRFAYPIHEYAREKHWGYWHICYSEKNWLRSGWFWALEQIMAWTGCVHSAYTLNRIEKIRAGILLGQHRSPRYWLDGSICHNG